jgi:hypothetical protein
VSVGGRSVELQSCKTCSGALVPSLSAGTVALRCGFPSKLPRACSKRTQPVSAGPRTMTTTLVLTDALFDELADAARLPVETAAVLLASVVTAPNGDVRILGRKIRWVEDHAYLRREPSGLSIASEGYVPALAEAETIKASCIWFHTHPGDDSSPQPSLHDRKVDEQIADLFRFRSGSDYYGTPSSRPAPTASRSWEHFSRRMRPCSASTACGRSAKGGA